MKSIASIFAEALNQANLEKRNAYLDQACRDDSDLKREILELLEAHDSAEKLAEPERHLAQLRKPPQHANVNSKCSPARHASEFLAQLAKGVIPDIDSFLAAIPPDSQPETRERIETLRSGQAVLEEPWAESIPSQTRLPEIPGFRIERQLGRGGVGTVYLAHDETLNRNVALKVIDQTGSEVLRKRILDEARRSASLRDPAIVTIFSVHDRGSMPAIVMEFVEGFPIHKAVAGLTFHQRAKVLMDIARGLSTAHRREIIHRDLKPENVIMGPDLRPKILDFGLAISAEEASAGGRLFEGTPRYASPEQVAGKPLSFKSDIFSFGSLMFVVLTGRPPFDGSSLREVLHAICTSEPPFLRDVSIGIPEDLQAICLACMAWNSADRPAADEVALDLGRFLAGEPVRRRPALYSDILRRRINECSNDLVSWERQGMISIDEKDRLQTVHRRILADEDHWIIDARKISIAQTVLYTGTWLVVLAATFLVWFLRTELSPPMTWLAPLAGTTWLLFAGILGFRQREPLASASFLAGAVLSMVPTSLAFCGEFRILPFQPEVVTQLFPGSFSNAQVFAACSLSLGISALAWRHLRLTGFAWTTAALSTMSFLGFLLCRNWLGQDPEVAALWCLPLVCLTAAGLWAEKRGRVRWALPFHLIAFATLVGSVDVMAAKGPTLAMIGMDMERFEFLDPDRQLYLSLAANGYLFLLLMLLTERSQSLDLRRASRILEPLALLHILGALYANATAHRGAPGVLIDVNIYLGSVVLLFMLGPWRSRWRILVGALGGLALGSYLLIDLDLVGKTPFTYCLGAAGLLMSAGTYAYLRIIPRMKARDSEKRSRSCQWLAALL